jgi:hypothetical protein
VSPHVISTTIFYNEHSTVKEKEEKDERKKLFCPLALLCVKIDRVLTKKFCAFLRRVHKTRETSL